MYRVTVDGVELEVGFQHCDGWPRYTVCTISAGDRRLTYGTAKCSAADQFCRATGRKLALTRAVAELPKHVRAAIWEGYWRATETPKRERDDWNLAVRCLLEHYPEDIFPPDSNSPDAKAGSFARRILTWLLDPIERARLAALCGEEEKDD